MKALVTSILLAAATVPGCAGGRGPGTSVAATSPDAVVGEGPRERATVTGRVLAVNPDGTVSVDSEHGRFRIPIFRPQARSLAIGREVTVHLRVHGIDLFPVQQDRPPSPVPAAVSGDRDYAVVVGKVLQTTFDGRITVDVPGSSITVWLPTTSRFPRGADVEVWSAVEPR